MASENGERGCSYKIIAFVNREGGRERVEVNCNGVDCLRAKVWGGDGKTYGVKAAAANSLDNTSLEQVADAMVEGSCLEATS